MTKRVASVRRDLVQQLWEGNNLGRLQKDYSHWLRAGDKQKAQQAIADYRQALQQAATDTGVSVENSGGNPTSCLPWSSELNEAFRGRRHSRKRNAIVPPKHATARSLKSQRSQ